MGTLIQAAERPVASRSIERDLDRYLDAIVGATAIFREAVGACLQAGSDGARWQQARRIAEHMRTLDDMQQVLETGMRHQSVLRDLICEMIDPLTGVSRLLKDMKRQVIGFAVESDLSRSGVCIPQDLVPDMLQLTDEVCAAVDVLVAGYRPSLHWWKDAPSGTEDRGVSWHESEADRLSMQLLKKIFGDDSLEIEAKLTLARFVEEIDRVADHAEEIDRELCTTRTAGQTTADARDSH
ncbi:MAG: hypothetical protein JNK92_11175 [Dechloromonas sp.]|nr:hypothetical protein [Dechloromonas sp.]